VATDRDRPEGRVVKAKYAANAMTPAEREALYDAEIAPQLRALAARCEQCGLSFVCEVEWSADPEADGLESGGGTTKTLAQGSSFATRLVELSTQVRGNVDSMIIALLNLPPGNSLFLRQLGQRTE